MTNKELTKEIEKIKEELVTMKDIVSSLVSGLMELDRRSVSRDLDV